MLYSRYRITAVVMIAALVLAACEQEPPDTKTVSWTASKEEQEANHREDSRNDFLTYMLLYHFMFNNSGSVTHYNTYSTPPAPPASKPFAYTAPKTYQVPKMASTFSATKPSTYNAPTVRSTPSYSAPSRSYSSPSYSRR